MDEKLGFEAMRQFIDAYWRRGGETSKDLRHLLDNIDAESLTQRDGTPVPADPAMWQDWLDAIERAKRGDSVT